LALCASLSYAVNAPSARLKGVDFKDGVVRIQLTDATTWRTTSWRSANRFIVDISATDAGTRVSTLPVDASRIKAVRWTQFKPDTARVVLDLTDRFAPVVLSSPPTDLIEIRVASPARPAATVKVVAPASAERPTPSPDDSEKPVNPGPPPPVPDPATDDAATPAPGPGLSDQIEDIVVERGDDNRPQRIVVKTGRATAVTPEWRETHLVLNLPDLEPGTERIAPVNDELCLRAYSARESGHAALVIDFTRRVEYTIGPTDDGNGFVVNLDLQAPEPIVEAPPNLKALAGKVVVLDAGHGGRDTGTRGPYVIEKEVALDVVLRLQRVLTSNGAHVILTRHDDTLIPLQRRPAIAMEAHADAFVSIHCNYAPSNYRGVEIWHRRDTAESRRLAVALYQTYKAATGFYGRGVKPESRAPMGGLAVLKHNTVPCALVELGFVNNPVEGKALAQPEWRRKAVEALAGGIARFLEGRIQ
jgi:N-acetylmuramoyl-L-alanine amidase